MTKKQVIKSNFSQFLYKDCIRSKGRNLLSYLTRSRHVTRLIASLAWDIVDVNFCIDLLKVDMLHLASSLIHLSPQRLDG